jgi:hypothetical protein
MPDQELFITGATVASFFTLYSMYSKSTGKLDPKQLKQIFGFENVTFSLKEINKVLALAGLTILGVSCAPKDLLGDASGAVLREHATSLLVSHSLYSTYEFYDLSATKLWVNNKRRLAIIAGQAALSMVAMETFPALCGGKTTSELTGQTQTAILSVSLALGSAHFYFMEIKPGPYQGKLAIRPWGYVAAVGAAVGLGNLLMGDN